MESIALPKEIIKCPSCKSRIDQDVQFCGICRYPFSGNTETQEKFLKTRRNLVNEYYKNDRKVKRAGNILIYLGAVSMLYAMVVMFFSRGVLDSASLIFLGFTAVYFITGFLGRTYGLVPLIIGAGLYFIEIIYILSFGMLLIGFVKALIFSALVVGIVGAVKATEAKAVISRKLGTGFLHALNRITK